MERFLHFVISVLCLLIAVSDWKHRSVSAGHLISLFTVSFFVVFPFYWQYDSVSPLPSFLLPPAVGIFPLFAARVLFRVSQVGTGDFLFCAVISLVLPLGTLLVLELFAGLCSLGSEILCNLKKKPCNRGAPFLTFLGVFVAIFLLLPPGT